MLLKAKPHYFVFLYQCLQHSRALISLHWALMINMRSSAYLELVVTQNLLLVGWILHVSIQGWAGLETATHPAQCSAAGGGHMPNHTCSPLLFT